MIEPAVADTNWLESADLYLASGDDCEPDRPIYQGDVFSDVMLPALPKRPLTPGTHPIEFKASLCMVVPHPCQCYHGDSLRPRLTVAPVSIVDNYDKFGPERDRAYDKFALPDLPTSRTAESKANHVADFGRLATVGSAWLQPENRLANLSHEGLGLLAKRVLMFQLRCPTTLINAMGFTMAEWNESFLMQAWIRRHKSLKGYSTWVGTPQIVPGVNDGNPVAPYAVRAAALDALLEMVSDFAIEEESEGGATDPDRTAI